MENKSESLIVLALCFAFFQTGCVPALVNVREPIEVNRIMPKDFPSLPDKDSSAKMDDPQSSRESEGVKVANSIKWENFFSDKNLIDLINLALKNNQELNIVSQRILMAQNEIIAREGEYQPRVGMGTEVGVEKVGKFTHRGATDATTQYEPGKFVPEDLQNYSLGLNFAWELDIWSRLRNASKAAIYEYLASIDGKHFLETKLVAEIASTYFELLALDKQLEIVQTNIEIQSEAVELVRLQKDAARLTSLAVKRFEAEVLKNRSRKYELIQEIVETENKLNILVGRFPQPIERDSKDFIAIVPKNLEAGVPVDLLSNRPDVKRAEHELEATKLNVKSTRTLFYPSLSIEARAGYESFRGEHLITPESIFYNVAGNLTAPLLNRNAIKAEYFNANAKQIQAVFEYEQAILNAYTEVANQLASIENVQKTLELKTEQTRLLTESIEISNTLFKAARADYVEVLMTRRDALEAQMELIEIKKEQLNSYISLYQALGGGWSGAESDVE
jgi:multidrug efflux system outer membrane protein